MKEVCNSHHTKLGAARKIPASRIWIEGKRLTLAGFKPGQSVWAIWHKDEKLELRLDGIVPTSCPVEQRTVSGKGDKPIIDITGAKVRDTFTGAFVEVFYYPGRIVIRNAE